MLFDREDGAINLCEIKYAPDAFKIDKDYGRVLAQKLDVFETHFKTKKQIFLTMITTFGMKESIWSQDLIANEVTLDALFGE